jgi:aspartate-semialdehyde dehydrogenase
MTGLTVAMVGATGAVGREMWRLLPDSAVPVERVLAYTGTRSAGTELVFRGHPVRARALDEASIEPVDLALFSAGADAARAWAPRFAALGATVVDNSSGFRADLRVPLIVPEVNGELLDRRVAIVANPNCSTIQMVVALAPLHRAWGLRGIKVATYQSVSGAGARAMTELVENTRRHLAGDEETLQVFPHPIAFNVLPHIGDFDPAGESREEGKMREETRRLLGLPDLPVSATCVRVPVLRGHSEAVWASFATSPDPEGARGLLRAAGVMVEDDPRAAVYPLARRASGRPEVFVGRIRPDGSDPRGLALWVVSDNLLKGAATNAVQIAEVLAARGFLGRSGR